MDEENLKPEEDSLIVKWWKARSELEKKLLLSLAVALLLIFGMLLFSTIKPKPPPKPCSTPGCLLAASQVISYTDPTVDPCDDFLKFSCGKLIESFHGDTEAAPRKVFEKQIERQIFELIKEPIKDDDHYVLKSQKEFYQGCMNESNGEQSLEIFKEFLNELNGWPVVVGSSWKPNLFDWTQVVTKLRKRGYEYTMILHIGIRPDPEDVQKMIISIGEPYIKVPEDKNRELYKKYMTDVAVALGAKPQRAEEDMEKVLDFMEKLKELGAKNRDTNDGEDQPTRLTVKEFQMYNYELDWLKFINDMVYPNEKYLNSDYAIFPTPAFMDEFFDLMDRTPERIQANYIIWSVLEEIMPLLSKELIDLQENYNYLTKTETLSDKRFEYCVYLVQKKFFPPPSFIDYTRKYLPSETREQVQELSANIKSEFSNILSEADWISDEVKEKAVEKLEGIIDVVGTDGDYFDDAIFEERDANKHYKNIEGSTFFQMYLNSTRNEQNQLFSAINMPENDSIVYMYDQVLLYHKSLYFFTENIFVLPVVFIESSFCPDQPMYMNYGALGSEIGKQLTEDLCTEGGTKYTLWNKEIEKTLNQKAECISKDLRWYNNEELQNKTTEEIIAKIAGPQISYAAYMSWAAENGEEDDLIGIDYSTNQLFWISAMSYQCSMFNENDLQELFENYDTKVLKLTAFIRNNENFENDFGCAANSPMNPQDKCQVF